MQHLQTKVAEQEEEYRKLQQTSLPSVRNSADLIGKQVDERTAIFRTCRELRQADPSLSSGMYWIDPDGQGVGDDPIYVECDMTTGPYDWQFLLCEIL